MRMNEIVAGMEVYYMELVAPFEREKTWSKVLYKTAKRVHIYTSSGERKSVLPRHLRHIPGRY
jgi:hypothetical protein